MIGWMFGVKWQFTGNCHIFWSLLLPFSRFFLFVFPIIFKEQFAIFLISVHAKMTAGLYATKTVNTAWTKKSAIAADFTKTLDDETVHFLHLSFNLKGAFRLGLWEHCSWQKLMFDACVIETTSATVGSTTTISTTPLKTAKYLSHADTGMTQPAFSHERSAITGNSCHFAFSLFSAWVFKRNKIINKLDALRRRTVYR